MSARFPWYDSPWLDQFVRAKELIAERYPNRLADFLAAFEPLRTRRDYQVTLLDGVIDESVTAKIKDVIRSLKARDLETHEMAKFGRWVVHDHPMLTELQATTTELVSRVAGEEVEPCYNFLSMYTKLGRCAVHMDAPSAKWTLDICVDQSEVWPIHFSQIVPWPEDFSYEGNDWSQHILTDPQNRFSSFSLNPGQALLFSGSSQWHYRDPLTPKGPNGFCHLLFFHFVPKGTSEIVDSRNWARIFDVAELLDLGASETSENPA